MDDQGLTKTKASRSRAACDPCRLVKQKCDGPSMIPCRRCQLYSLQCSYAIGNPSGAKKTAKLTAAAVGSGAATPPLQFPQTPAHLDQGTNNLLHDMAARLRSIESAISSLQLSNLSSGSSSSTRHGGTASHHPSASPPEGSSPHSSGGAGAAGGASEGAGGGEGAPAAGESNVGETAVQAINDAVDLLSQVASTLPSLAALQSLGGTQGGSAGEGDAPVGAGKKYDEGIIERVLQTEGWVRPDALDRGVMTMDECDKTFEIFFTRLAPWTPFFPAIDQRTNALPDAYAPLAIRARSPLLFHTILLATAYFLLPSPGERSKRVYLGLTGIVNELIAPVIISMSKADMTSDTIRSLLLFVMWKPVQHAHFLLSSTHSDPSAAEAERFYKNNAASSASVWLLETHLLRALSLPSSAPLAFAHAVQRAGAEGRPFDAAYVASSPSAQKAVDDLRLVYWTLVVDAHGALTTGRAAQFSASEGALALRTARALAGLNLQASDVRLAAFVDLYEVVRAGLHAPWADVAQPWREEWAREMDAWNARVEAWEQEWSERLKAAFVGGEIGDARDKVAWNVLGNKHLCKAVLNASVFHRWNRSRRFAPHGSPSPPISPPLASASSAPPTFAAPPATAAAQAIDLSPAEWRFVQLAIDAIERMVFQFSVESRVLVAGKAYDGARRVQWPERDPVTGLRRPLTVDTLVAESMKTSHDPVSCIGIVYPLILLSKICNAGLARCELTTMNQPPDPRDIASVSSSPAAPSSPGASGGAGVVPARPRAILHGRKLCTLLNLGADFLEAVAPTPAHPAAVHAKTLRTILKAGTWGQDIGVDVVQQVRAYAAARAKAASEGDGAGEKGAGALLAAILAQMSPSPVPQGAASAAAPATPCFQQFASGVPASAFAAPPPAPAGEAPFFPLVGEGFGAFSSSTFAAPQDAFASTAFSSGSTSTSGAGPALFPSPSSQAFSLPTPSAAFPSFASPAPSLPAAMGMEVDADALSGLDWSALERQLGMESGSLSAGFGAAAAASGEGGGDTGERRTPESAGGGLDWMGRF
ncbi:hypothetical protein JCM10450v2_003447 [Rhodotorula kratochvilovae]